MAKKRGGSQLLSPLNSSFTPTHYTPTHTTNTNTLCKHGAIRSVNVGRHRQGWRAPCLFLQRKAEWSLSIFRQAPGSGGKEGDARARVAFSVLLLSLVALCARAMARLLRATRTPTRRQAGGARVAESWRSHTSIMPTPGSSTSTMTQALPSLYAVFII